MKISFYQKSMLCWFSFWIAEAALEITSRADVFGLCSAIVCFLWLCYTMAASLSSTKNSLPAKFCISPATPCTILHFQHFLARILFILPISILTGVPFPAS
jgi:hypothetical protein